MDWQKLDLSAVYSKTLCELMEQNPNVVCLEADLAKATGTFSEVRERFPERFINAGVAEADMICIAAGLAREGKIPFCATFTCFATRRVYDQIDISVAYADNNVKIIGTAPGITQGPNGGTHMCFLDMAIMRVMPNMHVYSPCDAYELRSMMKQMVTQKQPTYMQLIRPRVETVFDESYVFQPGKAVTIKEGADVTLVSEGYMTHVAQDVAQLLEEEDISVELLHYPSIKPFDSEALIASARKTGAVVTVENQTILGGLGGTVCEVLSENLPTPVKRLGIPDQFGEVATEQYLFDKHGFGPKHIAQACRKMTLAKSMELDLA